MGLTAEKGLTLGLSAHRMLKLVLSNIFYIYYFTSIVRLLSSKPDVAPSPCAAYLGTEPGIHGCHLCFHLVNKDQKWLLF